MSLSASAMARLLALWLVALAWWPSAARADAEADDDDALRFAVVTQSLPSRLCAAEKVTVDVTLRNDGALPWSDAAGDRVAYHWLGSDGSVVVREGRRSSIRGVVLPGRTTELRARVDAPAEPGRYTLVWAMVRDKVRWYPEPDAHSRVAVDVAAGGVPLAFAAALVEAPIVAAGETTSVAVRIENRGCAAWSSAYGDALAYHWFDRDGREVVHEGRRTPLPEVAPGATIELLAAVEGPPEAGSHVLQLEPVREPLAWFGAPSSGGASIEVDVAPPSLAWSLRAGATPTRGFAGATLQVPLRLRNEGTQTWSPSAGDRLSYRWRESAGMTLPEGVRTPLPGEVEPGEEVDLQATLELPKQPGRYTLRWQPVREGVRWFGSAIDDPDDTRDAVVIDVGPPQLAWTLLEADIPARLWASRTALVRVVVRNDGGEAWSPARGDRLSYRWSDAEGHHRGGEGMRSDLPHEVAPGESVEVSVRVRAPDEIGEAVLELGMVREHVAWFPAPSNADAARRPVRMVRWGLLLTAAALAGLGILGVAARVSTRPAFVAVMSEAWAPAHLAVVALAIGELFADLAGIEAWTGASGVSASAAGWIALPLVLVPRRWRRAVAALGMLFAFALALVDLGYLDFFGSILPTSALTAVHHLGDAHATVFSLWHPEYLQLAWPLCGWLTLFALAPPPTATARPGARWVVAAMLVACALPSIRGLLELAASPIGARVFSERDNVGRLGLWNAHLFEASRQVGRWLGVDALSEPQRREVEAFFAARSQARPVPTPPASPPNVVVIQVEAMQSWVVDARIDGEPVMPFLAAADGSALHFTHVFDQTAQGRTSDAEYLVLQSGHPLRTGALAFLRADDAFDTIAHRFAAVGYDTLSAHPYARGFWNRAVIHPRYGFASSMFRDEIGDGPMVGWGLSDVEFLGRMAGVLAARDEPFFGFFITLSLHHPYVEFPSHLAELELGALEGSSVGNYLQGMRHADRALAAFFAGLDQAGLAERTVVLVYGDHVAGLPWSDEVSALAGIDRWDPTVPTRNHRVPAFLWRPGHARVGRDDRIAGQIDLGPTVLDAAGVAIPPSFVGHSLLEPRPDAVVVLPDGTALAEDRMWIARGRDAITGGGCFDRDGRARARTDCDALARRAADELWASRALLDHDLFRALPTAR